jgi:hypothetical protein
MQMLFHVRFKRIVKIESIYTSRSLMATTTASLCKLTRLSHSVV